MIYRVVLLPRAISDLESHARWWAENHSLAQAERWLASMFEQLRSLARQPARHGYSAENGVFSFEIRDQLLGLGTRYSHRGVFTIHGDAVFVLTIRHNAQDRLRPSDVDPPGF